MYQNVVDSSSGPFYGDDVVFGTTGQLIHINHTMAGGSVYIYQDPIKVQGRSSS